MLQLRFSNFQSLLLREIEASIRSQHLSTDWLTYFWPPSLNFRRCCSMPYQRSTLPGNRFGDLVKALTTSRWSLRLSSDSQKNNRLTNRPGPLTGQPPRRKRKGNNYDSNSLLNDSRHQVRQRRRPSTQRHFQHQLPSTSSDLTIRRHLYLRRLQLYSDLQSLQRHAAQLKLNDVLLRWRHLHQHLQHQQRRWPSHLMQSITSLVSCYRWPNRRAMI